MLEKLYSFPLRHTEKDAAGLSGSSLSCYASCACKPSKLSGVRLVSASRESLARSLCSPDSRERNFLLFGRGPSRRQLQHAATRAATSSRLEALRLRRLPGWKRCHRSFGAADVTEGLAAGPNDLSLFLCLNPRLVTFFQVF